MRTSIEKFKSRVDLRQEQGRVTYWTFRHISKKGGGQQQDHIRRQMTISR